MKNKLLTLMMFMITMTFSSCSLEAQNCLYNNPELIYEYSYNNQPVRYVNDVAYYYCYLGSVWQWVVLPRPYYCHIVHHPHPMRYRPDYYSGRHYRGGNPYRHHHYQNHPQRPYRPMTRPYGGHPYQKRGR